LVALNQASFHACEKAYREYHPALDLLTSAWGKGTGTSEEMENEKSLQAHPRAVHVLREQRLQLRSCQRRKRLHSQARPLYGLCVP
jgi:hypothetical protein